MSDLEFLEVVFAPSELPDTPNVYGIFSQKDGECLYVGKATRASCKSLCVT